jgi:hypothetical protein
MQRAARAAADRPSEIMTIVASAQDRIDASETIASLLGVAPSFADQVLDMPLSRFLGVHRDADTE